MNRSIISSLLCIHVVYSKASEGAEKARRSKDSVRDVFTQEGNMCPMKSGHPKDSKPA